MAEKAKRTEIAALGEFGLIERLTQNIIVKNSSTIKGVGDDAAVIAKDQNKYLVVTTDFLVEGVHFNLMYHPLRHLGYKAVMANLSDVYAMNAWPQQITFSIAISNRFSVEALEEIYEGALSACEKHQVDLVGGDTTSSLKGLVISITAIGEVEQDRVTYRHTAKPGNLVCVSGDLGAAYMGLQLLEREKSIFLENPNIQPDLEGEKHIVGKFLLPEARRDIVEAFEELNLVPTAMMDISDGLSSDILHICKASGTGVKLYEDKLPIAEQTYERAMKFNIVPTIAAMNGGEDYELLFTIDPKDLKKVENNPSFSIIGHITPLADGANLLTKAGQVTPITAQGWNSFEE